MGRRRERRLAAIGAAGRRVKLDLFADPAGGFVGKPLNDEAGEGLGQEKCADVPNSPSSSGPKDNSLLLLGQYSDDEVADNACKEENVAYDQISPIEIITKVDQQIVLDGDIEAKSDALPLVNSKQESDPSEVEKKSNGIVEETCPEIPSSEKSFVEDSGMQILGEFASDWKIVMHEESKMCYYWNIQTGETSWEVPDIPSDEKVATVGNEFPVDADVDGSSVLYASVCGCATVHASSKESNAISNTLNDSNLAGFKCEISKIGSFTSMTLDSIDNSSEHLIASVNHDAHGSFQPQIHNDIYEHNKATFVDGTELIRKFENLLERLKAVKGSENHSCEHTWAYKYIIEVETRLCDCKALLSFEASIIPFWRNTEIQLERIETVIREKASGSRSSQEPEQVGDMATSVNCDWEKGGHLFDDENAASKTQEKILHLDVAEYSVGADLYKMESPDKRSGFEQKETIPHFLVEQPSSLHVAPKVDDDVDMDVEMELDDEICTTLQDNVLVNLEDFGPHVQQQQQHAQACLIVENPPIPSEEFKIPSPPEEWIPPPPPDCDPIPPPPDSDPIPPPPPDNDMIPSPPNEEPPSVTTSAYSETVHVLPYTEHYDGGYSATSYQYYTTSSAEAQNVGYYSHIDGTQVAQVPAQYFGALTPSSYSNAPTTTTEPIPFYDVHSGNFPPAIVGVDFGASVLYTDPGLSNQSNIYIADSIVPVELVNKMDDKRELPSWKLEPELPMIPDTTEKTSIKVAPCSAIASIASITSTNENVADATPTVSTRNTSKVVRTKKRVAAVSVPTLRSNKKVSSLVDKWKAAKEELRGNEDDEPEDAYEIFERKKKKEIDEWHAQQIASGDTNDNANFVPVRGDWRERVKRKKKIEPCVESCETSEDQILEEERQPDLVELAKGLLPGWQAYWDESSKKVYYGNLKTSETTWTRPSS